MMSCVYHSRKHLLLVVPVPMQCTWVSVVTAGSLQRHSTSALHGEWWSATLWVAGCLQAMWGSCCPAVFHPGVLTSRDEPSLVLIWHTCTHMYTLASVQRNRLKILFVTFHSIFCALSPCNHIVFSINWMACFSADWVCHLYLAAS